MSQTLWQQPYVNVFKHCNVGDQWKRSSKHGDVTNIMDKSIKCTVWRISGSIPANNFILCPRTGSQSLGLNGRYFYLLFKPISGKYFVIHMDIAAEQQLIVRLSFSNLFREFKATSTWLQFPFVCASPQARWTFLMIDLQSTLTKYVQRHFLYLKSVKLCANVLVKNMFTSDILFDPTLPQNPRHRLQYEKLLKKGMMPIPKEMAFTVPKGGDWTELYDLVAFPDSQQAHEMISRKTGFEELRDTALKQPENTRISELLLHKRDLKLLDKPRAEQTQEKMTSRSLKKIERQVVSNSRDPDDMSSRNLVGMVQENATGDFVISDEREVHVYSENPNKVAVHYEDSNDTEDSCISEGESVDVRMAELTRKKRSFKTLQPDPIMHLSHVVGFGGASYSHALWTKDGQSLVYPCHNLIVSMNVSSKKQRFLIGHTDKVCAIAFNGSTSLLASSQCSIPPVIRLWQYSTGQCLRMVKTPVSAIHSVSLSHSGKVLAAGGRDKHGKQTVLVWSISSVKEQKQSSENRRKTDIPVVNLIAKAHTDINMDRLRISGFDDTRMVSCGHNNVRLWRVKQQSLRSCPVNMGEYHHVYFTDVVFDEMMRPDSGDERRVLASTACGKLFVINYTQIQVMQVIQLEDGKINCLAVSELFCATGSRSTLKLWKIDFSSVFLETEQDGNVTAVGVSQDGLKVLLASDQGCIGVLDASARSYSTLMRSHINSVLSVSLHPRKQHVATVSADNTIRVWDATQHFKQLFEFSAPRDTPSCVAYHPVRNCLACGFSSGAIRIFHVSSARLLAEHRHIKDYITGLAFTSNGSYLLSCGADAVLALYDSSQQSFPLIRALANTVARMKELAPCAIALNRHGTKAAFVGPSEFAVTVIDAHTLDEVLRLDISSALCGLESEQVSLDIATRVCFSPDLIGQLLVATRSSRLLRFDADTGRIISEVCNVHRTRVSGVAVSHDGCLLVTSGDKLIKVWDYQMKLDINFQVFIGHSVDINQLHFSVNSQQLISIGDAVFVWDILFTTHSQMKSPVRSPAIEACSSLKDDVVSPRRIVPQPTAAPQATQHISSPLDVTCAGDEAESIFDNRHVEDIEKNIQEQANEQLSDESKTSNPEIQHTKPQSIRQDTIHDVEDKQYKKPSAFKHYTMRETTSTLSLRHYKASPEQSGLSLHAVLGYNGRGRDNVVWHPPTGLFVFTSGCLIVMEDLSSGKQKHLIGHQEEISTLSLQHNGQMLASASGARRLTPSQICIWDVNSLACKKVLSYHEAQIVGLSYSRDDRFLISVGDYSACSLAVWDTHDYNIVATAKPPCAIHSIAWDPFTGNEFMSVGAGASVLFWMIDESNETIDLNLCEGDAPREIQRNAVKESVEFTAISYAGNGVVYIACTTGVVSVWSTEDGQCVMHWPADDTEIGTLNSDAHRVISGSCAGHLKLWALASVDILHLRDTDRRHSIPLESDIQLDGAITSATFDEDLAVGVVSSVHGTIWFVNWSSKSTVRLISGHSQQVNAISFSGLQPDVFATCCNDGGLRLWSVSQKEQRVQFLTPHKSCRCVAFPFSSLHRKNASEDLSNQQSPFCATGYSDGSIRIFDISLMKTKFKLQPHAQPVTAMAFSLDGCVLISGCEDGLVLITSPSTGVTIRVINDHKHVPITCINVANTEQHCLWLAASADQRVSVWSADWSREDSLSLIDWLTFPSPPFTPKGSNRQQHKEKDFYKSLPPTLAHFSPTDCDLIVYTGYGLHKQILFYSLSQQQVLRTVSLTHWVTCMDISPQSHLLAVGCQERLVKLIDFTAGSFQDFTGHCDSLTALKFSPEGKSLISVGYNDIIVWNVNFSTN